MKNVDGASEVMMEKRKKRFFKLACMVSGVLCLCAMSSCVPLAIGAVAVAAGAIADEGFKYKDPSEEGGGDYQTPPADEDAGGYDAPVY